MVRGSVEEDMERRERKKLMVIVFKIDGAMRCICFDKVVMTLTVIAVVFVM